MQAARELAEQRRVEREKLDTANALLFRENEKLKRDIAAIRSKRDRLQSEVSYLKKEGTKEEVLRLRRRVRSLEYELYGLDPEELEFRRGSF